MGDKLMTELVTEQTFDPPQTAARETLKQAAAAYHNGEITKSANLFLKSWRILNIENLNYIAGRFDLLPPWNSDISKPWSAGKEGVINDYYPYNRELPEFIPEKLAFEYHGRILMGLCALSDLALACLGSTSEYKEKNYDWNSCDGTKGYALNVNALENIDFGDTTAEELDLEGKIWPKGSRLSYMFKTTDDMGYRLQSVDSFGKAAHKIASFGLFQLALTMGMGKEHSGYRKVVKNSMERILHLAEQKVSAECAVFLEE